MWYIVCAILGAALGAVLAWLLAANHTRSKLAGRIEDSARRASIAEGRAATLDATVVELRRQVQRGGTRAASGTWRPSF